MAFKGHIPWNKGKKGVQSFSAETCKKISIAKMGHTVSLETRRKIGIANKGLRSGHKISIETRDKMKKSAQKEKNYNWKGDQVGYNALHRWIENNWGRSKICEHCGRDDKKKYEWCNKDHTYKRNRMDWLRLCTSCHRKYDMCYNNYKIRGKY